MKLSIILFVIILLLGYYTFVRLDISNRVENLERLSRERTIYIESIGK